MNFNKFILAFEHSQKSRARLAKDAVPDVGGIRVISCTVLEDGRLEMHILSKSRHIETLTFSSDSEVYQTKKDLWVIIDKVKSTGSNFIMGDKTKVHPDFLHFIDSPNIKDVVYYIKLKQQR